MVGISALRHPSILTNQIWRRGYRGSGKPAGQPRVSWAFPWGVGSVDGVEYDTGMGDRWHRHQDAGDDEEDPRIQPATNTTSHSPHLPPRTRSRRAFVADETSDWPSTSDRPVPGPRPRRRPELWRRAPTQEASSVKQIGPRLLSWLPSITTAQSRQ